MNRIKTIACILFMAVAAIQFAAAQNKTDKNTSDATADFMSLRFGMFIHWGPVTLRGTEIGWSRNHEVAQSDYDSLYKEFDPVLFNADAWVKTAKNAGMKYLVITAKHHDGFCLWPTKYTTYNIMNTPFKKDVVGALAMACKKYGVKFGIYYTVLDWYDKDYPLHNDGNKTPDPNADMNKFVQYMKDQLKELVTNYHPFMIWFDGNWESPWTTAYGKDIYGYLKGLDPKLIVNNRLGKNDHVVLDDQSVGDFATPEQKIGQFSMAYPWESCITLCRQWAWKPNDKMKSLKECIQTLVRTAGGNGNLLLNVGPMPDGRMEARQVKRLKEIGDWLKINGRSVYGTLGGPYISDTSLVSTRKGNSIFLHVLNGQTTSITLPAIPHVTILKARLLNGASLTFVQDNQHLIITLPSNLASEYDNVIELIADKNVEKISTL